LLDDDGFFVDTRGFNRWSGTATTASGVKSAPPNPQTGHAAPPHYDIGKTVKRPENLKAIGKPGRSW
jgi:hypothetical protein